MDVQNIFTVDVEDYYQVTAFEKQIDRAHWDRYEGRVEANTHRVLDLLDRHQVKATFFVLGWVADRYPRLVREIHGRGHEIGSHGWWHRLIFQQTRKDFRRDVQQSRDLLEEIIGHRVAAYRAPSFSITKQSLFALEVLAEEGFTADSSVFPIRHDRYGIPGAEPGIHRIDTPAGSLWEFPPAVLRIAGVNWPVSGGGYFRLFPLWWTVSCLSRVNQRLGRPFVFYVHPWELDPQQPRLSAGTWLSRARHRVHLATTQRKLEALLTKFRFARMCDATPLAPPVAAASWGSPAAAP